jgi:hypothetical protein
MIEKHFSTSFKGIHDDSSHVSKSDLENRPSIFKGPSLTYRRMILALEWIVAILIHRPVPIDVQN